MLDILVDVSHTVDTNSNKGFVACGLDFSWGNAVVLFAFFMTEFAL